MRGGNNKDTGSFAVIVEAKRNKTQQRTKEQKNLLLLESTARKTKNE
jgi:hypothetical protein